MTNNINIIERKKPNTQNSLILQNNPNITTDNKSIIEEYFNFLIQSKHEQSNNTLNAEDDNNCELFTSYSAFFAYLIKSAFESKCHITEQITRQMAIYFQYVKKQRNNVLIHYGSQSNDFYVILRGKVDLIAPIEQQMRLYEKDYLRYLAYLIEYEEYDIINRLLSDNSNCFYLEIINSNKFWKMPHSHKCDCNRIPTYITIENLLKELTVKERNKLYLKRVNHQFSTEDYVNMIDCVRKAVRLAEDRMITVKVFHFKKISTLAGGNCFGGGENAMFITSKTTEFACLSREMFKETIQPIMKIMRRDDIHNMLSFCLFEKLSYQVFEMKYASLLIKQQAKKGTGLLSQCKQYKDILLLKKAECEVTTLISLSEIISHIMYLYERLQTEDSLKYKPQVTDLIKKDLRFKRKSKMCPITNAFYTIQKEMKVLTISSNDIVSSEAFCSKANTYIFNVSLTSSEGEYYSIDRDILNWIKERESVVKEADEALSKRNSIIIFQRLIEVYDLKIKYFSLHNREIIKKITQLSSPTHQLKTIFSVPKKTINPKARVESKQSPKKSEIEHPLEEQSYREIKVILPTVEKKSQFFFKKNTKETSSQTKVGTTSPMRALTPIKKLREPLNSKKFVDDGSLNFHKHYFKDSHHSVTGLIDVSALNVSAEISNEPLINTALNYLPHKKHSPRLMLHNSFKEQLFISNRKTENTSFLNYLTFKSSSIKNTNPKSAIMKYRQSLTRSISQNRLRSNNHSLLLINSQKRSNLSRRLKR